MRHILNAFGTSFILKNRAANILIAHMIVLASILTRRRPSRCNEDDTFLLGLIALISLALFGNLNFKITD